MVRFSLGGLCMWTGRLADGMAHLRHAARHRRPAAGGDDADQPGHARAPAAPGRGGRRLPAPGPGDRPRQRPDQGVRLEQPGPDRGPAGSGGGGAAAPPAGAGDRPAAAQPVRGAHRAARAGRDLAADRPPGGGRLPAGAAAGPGRPLPACTRRWRWTGWPTPPASRPYWREALAIFTDLGVAQAELVRRHLADPAGRWCDLCPATRRGSPGRSGCASYLETRWTLSAATVHFPCSRTRYMVNAKCASVFVDGRTNRAVATARPESQPWTVSDSIS